MEKIVVAYFCDFEPVAHAAHLDYFSHSDWYDHENAAAIEDKCEEKFYAGKWPWRQAYFAAVNYCYHDAMSHRKDAYGRKEIAGPFLTEEEALNVAKERFSEAVEGFRRE